MKNSLATTSTVPEPERPLLRRSPLLPGESLPSLLWRLQQLNGYDQPTMLAELVGAGTTNAGTRGIGGRLKGSMEKPAQEKIYKRLSALTCISPTDLYAATTHYFTSVLMPPGTEQRSICLPILPTSADSVQSIMHTLSTLPITDVSDTPTYVTVPIMGRLSPNAHLYAYHSAQFCPLCLRQDQTPYHRLLWMPVCVATCQVHRCLLYDRCPSCHRKVPIADVVGTACGVCGTALSEAQPFTLEDDPSGLYTQKIIQSWFTDIQTQPSDATRPLSDKYVGYRSAEGGVGGVDGVEKAHFREAGALHDYFPPDTLSQSLPDVQSRVLYVIVRELRRMSEGAVDLSKLSGHEEQRGQSAKTFALSQKEASPMRRYSLYSIAVTRLLNYRKEEEQQPQHGFARAALALYTQPGSLSGVSDKLVKLVVREQYRHEVALLRSEYATFEEATQLLGMSLSAMKKLVRLHHFATRRFGRRGKPPTVLCLKRADLDELYQKWKRTVPLAQACRSLGVSEVVAYGLVDSGLLHTARDVLRGEEAGSDGKDGRGGNADDRALVRFSPQEVNSCRSRILQYVRRVEAEEWEMLAVSERLVPIAQAAETLSHMCHMDVTVAGVLGLIMSGRLHAYVVDSTAASILATPAVTETEAETEMRVGVEGTEGAEGAESSTEGAESSTEGAESSTEENARVGLQDLYLSAPEVNGYGEEVRSAPKRLGCMQVAARMRISDYTAIKCWARRGLLPADLLYGEEYRFDPLVVEGFVDKYVVTKGAASILGTTPTGIASWVHIKRLVPVSGPGIDGSRLYLFHRADVQRLVALPAGMSLTDNVATTSMSKQADADEADEADEAA